MVDSGDGRSAQIPATRFREVLSRFASGVTVVTAANAAGPAGMTVQGFVSVSLHPPLVLFSSGRGSRAWPVVEETGAFCVNVLAADQQWLSELMATRGADKFRDVSWTPSPATGSPLLDGVLAHVDCRVEAVHEAGDHLLVVGRVQHLGTAEEDGPSEALLYFRGGYGATGWGS